MPDTSSIVIPIDPQTVDAEKAAALQKQYGAELEKTRGALSQVQGQRQDVTTRNLGAIDEAIQGLKNSRQTGPLAFDPAVSAAMSAGFLKTTPGVAGNFMTELGSAMGNAAPVIANKLGRDRDSFQILADLQAKRGEFEAKPLQEQQKTLEEREKEQATGLRTVEQAALKGATASERAAAKADSDKAKLDLNQQKLLEAMHNNARADMQAMLKGKEDVSPPDQDLLRRWHLEQHINTHNAQPGAIKINNPEALTDPEREQVKVLKAGIDEKGLGEKKAADLAKLRAEVQANTPKKYGLEVFQSLDAAQQQAILDKELADRILAHNAAFGDDKKKHLDVPVVDTEGAAAAKAAADRTRLLGSPEADAVKKEHLPVANIPNAYAGMSYPERKKRSEAEAAEFHRDISTERAMANDLAKRNEQINDAWVNYNNTDRKGPILGRGTALGSAPAQAFDKVVADMQLYNFPKGQGQISEGERSIMKNAGPLRELEPEALRTVLDTYRATTQRANEVVAFKEAWFRTHKTQQGAMEAWNRYIDSPQGSVMVLRDKQTGKIFTDIIDAPIDKDRMEIVRNPNRLGWKEFFDKENDGSLNKPRKRINPTTGKVEDY
jgi:hypothetical protein